MAHRAAGLRRRRLRRDPVRRLPSAPARARGADRPLPRPAAGGRAGDPRRERRPVDLRRPRRLGPARRPPPPRAGARHRLRQGARAAARRAAGPRPRPGRQDARRSCGDAPSSACRSPSTTRPASTGWPSRARRARPARPWRRSTSSRGARRPRADVDWLVNGAGAFEVGGPDGDNGLSGKKLVAQAYGSAVPIGGGATYGKDPHKVDPRGQALARRARARSRLPGQSARSDRLARLSAGRRRRRAGPRSSTLPDDEYTENAKIQHWQGLYSGYRARMIADSKRKKAAREAL